MNSIASFRVFFLSKVALTLPTLVLAVAGCAAEASELDSDSVGTTEQAQTQGCTLPSMFLVGTPRNFGVAPGGPLAMSCRDGAWEVEETFAGEGNVFAAGAFKFVQTGNFSNGPSWGDWAPRDGALDQGGDGNDIVIERPGRYRIRFDDRAYRYSAERLASRCSRETLVATGVSSRDGTKLFHCIGDGVFAAIVMTSQPNMSVSLDGAVRKTYGLPGRYLVEYNERTFAVSDRHVSPACAQSVAYARGSFNGWASTEMECENGHYALTIGDQGREHEFKFDTRGDWSENFGVFPRVAPRGDGHFDSVRNVFGNNIRITGRHHVHFYSDASFAFDRHD